MFRIIHEEFLSGFDAVFSSFMFHVSLGGGRSWLSITSVSSDMGKNASLKLTSLQDIGDPIIFFENVHPFITWTNIAPQNIRPFRIWAIMTL